jgi:hypothetical protein
MTEADQRKAWNEQQEACAKYCSPWAKQWIARRIALNAEIIQDEQANAWKVIHDAITRTIGE